MAGVVARLRSGGSIPGRSKIYLPNGPDISRVHLAYCALSTSALFPWVKQSGLRNTTCLPLVPVLRIIRRLPLFLFDFMAPRGTDLPFGMFMQQLSLGRGSFLGFPCCSWTGFGRCD